jgi:hypothetical protein
VSIPRCSRDRRDVRGGPLLASKGGSKLASAEVDQCTRRIVGFGVHRGAVDGVGLYRMFNRATQGHTPPTYLSSDHDRLYECHQWQANLQILDVDEIKTVPYVPFSHPSSYA